MKIDWSRLAEPQDDGYDSEVVLALQERSGKLPRERQSTHRLFDGRVSVVETEVLFPDGYELADCGHPGLKRAEKFIAEWPQAFRQCGALLCFVTPFYNTAQGGDYITGSVCGPAGTGFGGIAVSVDNCVGTAEAIVHEMAHHKLRALGVEFEHASRLITNGPEEKYHSPIRYDCKRPMTAVMHAMYSYTYIAALDVFIIKSGRYPGLSEAVLRGSLAVILPKLEFGRAVVLEEAKLDDSGAAFLAGYDRWLRFVLEHGNSLLAEYDVAPVPFQHPLVS